MKVRLTKKQLKEAGVSIGEFRSKYRTENTIEQDFVRRVKKMGCLPIKMNIWGLRSWPDRMVIGPNRLIEFIEFKKPGEKLTESQLLVHQQLEKWGFTPKVFDDAPIAAQYIDFCMKNNLRRV